MSFMELAKYGLPGVVLGVVLGVVGNVLKTKYITPSHNTALKIVLSLGLAFVAIFAIVVWFQNYWKHEQEMGDRRVTISLEVKPSLTGLVEDAEPTFKTHLTPTPSDNHVDVASTGGDSDVTINVSKLARGVAQLRFDNQQKQTQIAGLSEKTQRQQRFVALTMPKPAEAQSSVTQVLEAKDQSAVVSRLCSQNDAAQCGWAQLASGHSAAAGTYFSRAAQDPSLPKSQQEAALNALHYVSFTEDRRFDIHAQPAPHHDADSGQLKQPEQPSTLKESQGSPSAPDGIPGATSGTDDKATLINALKAGHEIQLNKIDASQVKALKKAQIDRAGMQH